MLNAQTGEPTKAQTRQTVLAILGMHRSGTSLAAIAVQRLGAATGSNLMPADEHNQRGYGEDLNVVRIHDSLLAALGRPWNTLRGTFPLPSGWTEGPEFERVRGELASYLRSEFLRVGGGVWSVKDPRLSILIPLWLQLAQDLNFDFIPVLCIRSPDAVARSIEKRDGMPSGLGRLLWLQYNATIVVQAGDLIKAVLSYDDWFANPDANISRLALAIGRAPSDADRASIVDELVDPQLRHQKPERSNGLYGQWQDLFDDWTTKQELPNSLWQEALRFQQYLDAFDPWRQAVAETGYTSRMMDSLKAETARVELEREEFLAIAERHLKAYKDVEQERDEILAAAERHYKAYQEIDLRWTSAKSDIARLERERDEVVAVANRHYRAYQEVDGRLLLANAEIDRLARDLLASELGLASANDEISRQRDEASRQRDEISRRGDEVSRQRDEISRLSDEIAGLYEAIEEHARSYQDLDRRHRLMMQRFGRFPLSLIMPSGVLPLPSEQQNQATDK